MSEVLNHYDAFRYPNRSLVEQCMFTVVRTTELVVPYDAPPNSGNKLGKETIGILPVKYLVFKPELYEAFLAEQLLRWFDIVRSPSYPVAAPAGFAWIKTAELLGDYYDSDAVTFHIPCLHIPAYISKIHLIAQKNNYFSQLNAQHGSPPFSVATKVIRDNSHRPNHFILHVVHDGVEIFPYKPSNIEGDLIDILSNYASALKQIGIRVMTAQGFAKIAENQMRQYIPSL